MNIPDWGGLIDKLVAQALLKALCQVYFIQHRYALHSQIHFIVCDAIAKPIFTHTWPYEFAATTNTTLVYVYVQSKCLELLKLEFVVQFNVVHQADHKVLAELEHNGHKSGLDSVCVCFLDIM